MNEIAVIVVLYNNKEQNYLGLCKQQNISLIIVDNTPERDLKLSKNNLYYIPLCYNAGIAKAQNIGIEKAKELNCKYIIFFDQDSEISCQTIFNLQKRFESINIQNGNIGAIGPAIVNKITSEKYKSESTDTGLSLVSTLISSGTMTSTDVITKVGSMNERLFIDLVDHEWCWRAMSKGFKLYMDNNVSLPHAVGAKSISFFGFPIIVSSPFRYFYQYRNTIWLLKLPYSPRKWRYKVIMRRFIELFIVPFETKHIFLTLSYMFKGIKAGLTSRL